jgi:predicted dehydrogenase
LAALPELYSVVAVSDPDPSRRAEAQARFECRTYETFDGLVSDAAVELIVVATPNHLHVQHSIMALDASRHVVCEKPVATSTREMGRLLERAALSDKVVAPFQSRRYEAMYCKICLIIASGVLGRIVEIRVCVHDFQRRWDWQTLREYGGGALRNTGSHFIDELLVFFGEIEPEVFGRLDRTLTSGDAEDHVKVIMYAKDAPMIDLEISSACAYPQDMWLVMGTRGGLRSAGDSLNWQYVDFQQLPPRPVDRHPTPDRKYNNETLPWQKHVWTVPQDLNFHQTHWQFYQDLFRTIRTGVVFPITLDSVARQLRVIEKCYMQCGME